MLWKNLDVTVLKTDAFFIISTNYIKITLVDSHMTSKEKQTYYCEYCDYMSGRRIDYVRHLSSVKHDKLRKNGKQENPQQISVKQEKQTVTEYYCGCCQFTCLTKKEAKQHKKSKTHITNENGQNIADFVNKYKCLKCDKHYDKYGSCWKHVNTCQGKKENIVVENIVMSTEIGTPVKKEKPKRKTIPLALRRSVWNKYIGEEIGKTLCLCCKISDISQMTFSCGHVVSVYNGGDINLENLKPICVSCNSSMGTQNMDEFIQNYGLYAFPKVIKELAKTAQLRKEDQV